jgi:hypothetical protein
VQTGSQGSLYAHRSLNHESRKRSFSASGPSFMSADLTKRLFEIVIGPWEVRNLITEKEVRRITLRDLEKMSQSLLPERP